MAIPDDHRRKMIRRGVLLDPERALDASAELWSPLALQLIAIIGERGFEKLYARTRHHTSINYIWIDRAVVCILCAENGENREPLQIVRPVASCCSFAEPASDHLAASGSVQIVGILLHHHAALIQKHGAVVGFAVSVARCVR